MAMCNLTDRELVDLYISGTESALEILINRHKTKVFSGILFMVNDRELAEDIFQDTFIKVIHTLKSKKYTEEGKFYPWVQRIAHNLVIDYFRKAKKMRTIAPTDEFDIFSVIKQNEANVQDALIKEQIEVDVQKMLDYLPEEQKNIIVLRMYQDLSFKEIAELTNVSINTALGRMRYAVMNLRKLADKHNMILTN